MSENLNPVCDYSPKQIAIFEAVAKLLHQGRKSHDMKVAEIARTAGIGKGTAYEYFSSKNELIRQAFIYHIDQESMRLQELIEACHDFKQTFFLLLDFVLDMAMSRMPSLWAMLSTLDAEEITALSTGYDQALETILAGIEDTLEDFMQLGMQQGYVDLKSTRMHRQFVLTGSLSAFIHMSQRNQRQCLLVSPKSSLPARSDEHEALLQEAWNLFCRGLDSDAKIGDKANLG